MLTSVCCYMLCPGKVLLCSTAGCSGSFPNMKKLMEHMRQHHKPNIYFLCESCRTKLRSYRGLLTHLHTCSKVPQAKQRWPTPRRRWPAAARTRQPAPPARTRQRWIPRPKPRRQVPPAPSLSPTMLLLLHMFPPSWTFSRNSRNSRRHLPMCPHLPALEQQRTLLMAPCRPRDPAEVQPWLPSPPPGPWLFGRRLKVPA
uniref:Zinc finger protein 414 n=1 Tax=Takifugu rubripes TaxID=31033 RepID=A0A674MSS5_TAKRU